ncbi:unnamed protein product [Mytilus edulis]|uniref:Reverse transcriptase domain-containing protein n=1 Tax=Mytilus edulis TaxID=6550 RepID=A0A8S3TWH0_MYTED|nr:unnamed protein product [Mytilus edulis]
MDSKLKSVRAGHKGAVTKLLVKFDELKSKTDTEVDEVEALDDAVTQKQKTLIDLNNRLLEQTSEENLEQEITDSDEYMYELDCKIRQIRKFIKSFETNTIISHDTVGPSTSRLNPDAYNFTPEARVDMNRCAIDSMNQQYSINAPAAHIRPSENVMFQRPICKGKEVIPGTTPEPTIQQSAINEVETPNETRVMYSSQQSHNILLKTATAPVVYNDQKVECNILFDEGAQVSPSDFDQLGFIFDGKYYFDRCLPQGASISCSLFEKFSTALHWVTELTSGNSNILHYLDDFLFGGEANSPTCQETLETFKKICSDWGVPLAEDKTVQPTEILTFLGIEFDTLKMEMRLPGEKLTNLKQTLQLFLHSKKVTLRQLQSLIGCLTAPLPSFLVIQLGSNDLGISTSEKLFSDIECDLLRLHALYPALKIIWSDILMRRYWHNANCGQAIERARKRVNLRVKNLVLSIGGCAIRHSNIRAKESNLFRYDGTHLSKIGNDIYLNNLQGALEQFMRSGGPAVFPQ